MFGFDVPSVPEVAVEEVWEALQKKKKIVLLDVRTPHEYTRGNIQGSVNIPVEKVKDGVAKKFPNKNSTIYVYCLSGSRSVMAVATMSKMGYKNVFSMTSGLLSWRAKGFPLTQPAG